MPNSVTIILRIGVTALFILLCLASSGHGQPTPSALSSSWPQCPQDSLAALLTSPLSNTEAPDPSISFDADSAEIGREIATLSGTVLIEQGDQRLEAPAVTLDRKQNQISAQGLRYGSPSMALQSSQGQVDLVAETGLFTDADYYIAERNGQGSAQQIEIKRAQRISFLQNITYSTCVRGQEFWQLRAAELSLDQNKGRGIARDITLAIKDVPVFYWPYLSFPIDDRRHSGFLVPRLGLDEESGVDIQIPYYWNIAPNQDATFTTRLLSKRGVLLGGEYRYLDQRQRGEISLEYIPHDSQFNDDRSAFRIEHQSRPLPRVFTDLLYQYVSDDDYLDDFDNRLTLLTPNFLERRFDIRYHSNFWSVLGRLQGFQTLDDRVFSAADEPYDRLPQILFNGRWPQQLPWGLNLDLRSELVHFEAPNDQRVTSNRLDIKPTLSRPFEQPWGFVTPQLSYRYTAYQLNDNTLSNDDSPQRSAPIFSVDSGLFFERPWPSAWLGDSTVSLEPRLFYLYVPERNQEAIPLFDSIAIDPSFTTLFLDNRFTGADRLGDANQITTAITGRVISNADGREQLRASLGQIHFFDNRSVTASTDADTDELDDKRSDLFAEAQVNLDAGWALRSTLQWDMDENRTERSSFDLRYRPQWGGDGANLFNIGHRFARDDLEQVDLSFLWTLNSQWRTVGRLNYSLDTNNTLEALAGFEYGDCCWALRMLARHHRDEPDAKEADTAVYMELELKGLAGIGNRIDKLLEESILGYEPIRYPD